MYNQHLSLSSLPASGVDGSKRLGIGFSFRTDSIKLQTEEIAGVQNSTLPVNFFKMGDFQYEIWYFWKMILGEEHFPTD